jgi:hypothetical protein
MRVAGSRGGAVLRSVRALRRAVARDYFILIGWLFSRTSYCGIRLAVLDARPHQSDRQLIQRLEEALHVLRVACPARWQRLQRDVRTIAVAKRLGVDVLGRYVASGTILIQCDFLNGSPVSRIGATIVHEATHAWLIRNWWGEGPAKLERVEAICSEYGIRAGVRIAAMTR